MSEKVAVAKRKNHHLVTHGYHGSRTYSTWQSMKNRCSNPNYHGYLMYWGANPPITVCERWRNSFGATPQQQANNRRQTFAVSPALLRRFDVVAEKKSTRRRLLLDAALKEYLEREE